MSNGDSTTTPFLDLLPPGLPQRNSKPRTAGVTMVIDKQLGWLATRDLGRIAGKYIDFLKFGFGTAAMIDQRLLRRKIAILREHGIEAYPGGTLFEVIHRAGNGRRYLTRLRELGFRAIEISDGVHDLSPEARKEMISASLDAGFKVLTEVGKKDPARQVPPEMLAAQISTDLACGADFVIVESRESGRNIGIYDKDGNIKVSELDILLTAGDPNRLIWEAPLCHQQTDLIRRIGPNVNLGNIQLSDVLALETMRRGLRWDTISLIHQ